MDFQHPKKALVVEPSQLAQKYLLPFAFKPSTYRFQIPALQILIVIDTPRIEEIEVARRSPDSVLSRRIAKLSDFFSKSPFGGSHFKFVRRHGEIYFLTRILELGSD